jgi:hypothetical protein
MSIWDIFTGGSAKDAAAQNAALYQDYQKQGLADLGKAYDPTLAAVQGATAAFNPLSDLGAKYGKATDLYMGALGVNGQAGNQAAQSAFQTGPGFDFAVSDAADRAAREAVAKGIGLGGNAVQAITDRTSNLYNQEYGNWLNRLQGFVPQEQQAVGQAAAGTAAGKGAEAGFYQTDAQNKVNLRGNVAGGIANSNTAAANAAMQASGNFWNGLMNLGSAAIGAAYPIKKA